MTGPSYHGRTHLPGTDDHIRLGLFQIVVGSVAVGDDAGPPHFIPSDLDGSRLRQVELFVKTVSSSGKPTVQIRNITNGNVDILSTKASIDVGEKSSLTAATPAVINATNSLLAKGDEIAIDIDIAGTGTDGLTVKLGYW